MKNLNTELYNKIHLFDDFCDEEIRSWEHYLENCLYFLSFGETPDRLKSIEIAKNKIKRWKEIKEKCQRLQEEKYAVQ